MIGRLVLMLLLSSPLPVGAEALANKLFGSMAAPSQQEAMPIGSYARGCSAGSVELPESGPTWQAMRLSRERNFGHPMMVQYLMDLSQQAAGLGWGRADGAAVAGAVLPVVPAGASGAAAGAGPSSVVTAISPPMIGLAVIGLAAAATSRDPPMGDNWQAASTGSARASVIRLRNMSDLHHHGCRQMARTAPPAQAVNRVGDGHDVRRRSRPAHPSKG